MATGSFVVGAGVALLRYASVLALLATGSPALAQTAPIGAHYAGRTADTGHGASSPMATGNYATSVPLDLPGDRAGLPIPLQIVQTGRGVGAAGLGWDVTTSHIHRDTSFAHRRPQFRGAEAPQARARVTLSLLGQPHELVRRPDNLWVTRDGTLALTARDIGGVWQVFDANGRTYEFVKQAAPDFWLLTAIRTSGGAVVRLTYDLVGEGPREVTLRRIEYNTEAASGCAKHVVQLDYNPALSAPIGYAHVGNILFARSRTLKQIDVSVRASLGDAAASCNAAMIRLQRYAFSYQQRDVDAQLPRLSAVSMTGRASTPEANQPLLIAAYEYGAAVKGDRVTFERTQTIALPAGVDASTISVSQQDSSTPVAGPGERYGLWQTLQDLTGDGRPDFVYKQNGKLRMAYNRPSSGGGTTFGVTTATSPGNVPVPDAVFGGGPLDAHTTTARRLRYDAGAANTMDVWRRSVDVNGDGRLDIIDAAKDPKAWVVYLNTPGPGATISWQQRKISTAKLGDALRSLGYELPGGGYVPLARRISALASDQLPLCLKFRNGEWKALTDTTLSGVRESTDPETGRPVVVTLTWKCDAMGRVSAGPPSGDAGCVTGYINDTLIWREGPRICLSDKGVEKTYTLWDLADLNGDGYPDFAFNDAGPKLRRNAQAATGAFPGVSPPENAVFIGVIPVSFAISSTKILAAFNVAGVRLAKSGPPTLAFSSPVVFRNAARGVGLGLWEDKPTQPGTVQAQEQTGGLADVNGDGLADWVNQRTAYLGDGRSVGGTTIALPGPLSAQSTNRAIACEAGQAYRSSTTATLRDITGDGTPDYVSRELWVGTGAGFAGPYAIDAVADFSISTEAESCDGGASRTISGLYDVDADGKADFVKLDGSSLQVWQLSGADAIRRGANISRIVSVDNGYGAKTRISYRSAKEDASTAHQVASPEIVVSAVATTGAQDLGGSLAETRYAYGGAGVYFDTTADAFRFHGYDRVVEMRTSAGPGGVRTMGRATITDNWPGLSANSPVTSTVEGRWVRSHRQGHPREVFVLRGSSNADPWTLLTVTSTSANVIGATQLVWDAKRFQGEAADPLSDCQEIVRPYDWEASIAAGGIDMCKAHGFGFVATSTTWYGAAPPPASSNLQKRIQVLVVDEFGRVTRTQLENDLFRADDDLCIDTAYATPVDAFPRILDAVATRTESSCDRRSVISSNTFLYDALPVGSVREGRLTSRLVDQRITDSGELIRQIRIFDAAYDPAGNVVSIRTERSGATRTTAIDYDPFGIVPIRTRVLATGLPEMKTETTYDLGSLQPKSVLDPNGTAYGADYDGFGRPVRATVKPAGGDLGVLSTTAYVGFAGASSGGRRVETRTYAAPTPPAQLDAMPSQLAISYFDELGRPRFTLVSLGADYGTPSAVAIGARAYDELGRVAFVADPFPAGISATAGARAVPDFLQQYGSTYHYKSDGELDCLIRGQGRQALTSTGDAAIERFATCFTRTQLDHVDIREQRDADALMPNSPTAGVVHRTYATAIGRAIERTTEKGGVRLESARFTQDRLGQLTSMTRYLDPVALTGGVRVQRRVDGLGQTVQLTEAQNAVQSYTYSAWGEPLETRWQDGATDRRLVARFDAFGRITSREEVNNGVVDPATVNSYVYDAPFASDRFSPTFTLGRLARAASPTGTVDFSYDAFGRTDGRLHGDREGDRYIERMDLRADGQPAMVQFNLPDNAFATETVKFGYDSAGRLRDVAFADRAGNGAVYQAREIDPLGRVRSALYGGKVGLEMRFDDTGRRLLRGVSLHSELGVRELQFETYDALGREIRRTESRNGQPPTVHLRYYDALGRIAITSAGVGSSISEAWQVRYDPLGNVIQQKDITGSSDATMTYGQIDPDRVCQIRYGDAAPTTDRCNVAHDAVGNIVAKPTRTMPITLSYFNFGNVRSVGLGDRTATFTYDALGKVNGVELPGAPSDGARNDRRYGALLERRTLFSGEQSHSILSRTIPAAGPMVARRGGPGKDWIFELREPRGGRFFVDEAGAFVQDVDYRAFGEAASRGAAMGTSDYANRQWNQGDDLGPIGLTHIGARLYDPTMGRFMSRDPLFVARGAATTNAYAFSRNDPINRSDPSGLDDDFDNVAKGNDAFGLGFDLAEFGVGLKVADDDLKFFAKSVGPLGDAGKLAKGFGIGADVVGIAMKTVTFADDPTFQNGYLLTGEVVSTGLGAFGGLGAWFDLWYSAGGVFYDNVGADIVDGWATNARLELDMEVNLVTLSRMQIQRQVRLKNEDNAFRSGCGNSWTADCARRYSTVAPPGALPVNIPSQLDIRLLGNVSRPITPITPQPSRPGSSSGSDAVIIGIPGGACSTGGCDYPNF